MLHKREPIVEVEKTVENEKNDPIINEEPPTISREEEIRRLREIEAHDLADELTNNQNQNGASEDDPCEKCKRNPTRKCRECGCQECGLKDDPDKQLFCEECQYVTHLWCLDPPLEEIPEGDFYCPNCKNDASEIVNKGERVKYSKARAKMPSRQAKINRDWGRGMATAGRTKTNTSIPKNHFGPIPGVDVGMAWQYRIQCSEVGVHTPPVAGISAQANIGCQSLVLAGGYEDDEDFGFEFTYTGSGGRDLSGNKRTSNQEFDQTLTRTNRGIAISCAAPINDKYGAEAKDWKKGKPIRVLRSYKFKKHSTFAPEIGVRYDGIYRVVKYYPEKGQSGFKVWKFLLRRDDPSPAPWEEGAKKYSCIMKNEGNTTIKSEKRNNDENSNNKSKKAKIDEQYELENELLELIKKDFKNEKQWNELIEFKARKDHWFEKVREEFECKICYELMLDPVTFPCCHSCCKNCLKRGFKAGDKKCWSCRADLEAENVEEYKNEDLKKCLEFLFPAFYNN